MYENKIIVANECVFPEDWTVNDLMGSHRSRLYNPLIANALFRAGFIEAWGRGIQKIKDSCAEAGNPMPEYTVKREDIMVMFQSMTRDTTQGVTQTDIQTCDNSIPMRIIKVIKENPALSQRQIAQMLWEIQASQTANYLIFVVLVVPIHYIRGIKMEQSHISVHSTVYISCRSRMDRDHCVPPCGFHYGWSRNFSALYIIPCVVLP